MKGILIKKVNKTMKVRKKPEGGRYMCNRKRFFNVAISTPFHGHFSTRKKEKNGCSSQKTFKNFNIVYD